MKIRHVAIDDLQSADRNPKRHDGASIRASISRFGYVEPIVLDVRTNKLVTGHGRVEALRRLQANGGNPPDGVDTDWSVPVIEWTSTSDAEAEAYLLASNKLVESGGWDEDELRTLLQSISDDGMSLDGIGFDDAELRSLLAVPMDDGLPDAMSDFVKPEPVAAPVATVAGESKISQSEREAIGKGDQNWFYIEFYGDPERFETVKELLKDHMRTPHEMNHDAFEEMVRAYVGS